MTETLTPRPAATILLLREAPGAPEVFMLQRTSKAVFLPGAFVFPGGALDPDDASERAARRVRGLDDKQASTRMGLPLGRPCVLDRRRARVLRGIRDSFGF